MIGSKAQPLAPSVQHPTLDELRREYDAQPATLTPGERMQSALMALWRAPERKP